jgi:hypothetical protein
MKRLIPLKLIMRIKNYIDKPALTVTKWPLTFNLDVERRKTILQHEQTPVRLYFMHFFARNE